MLAHDLIIKKTYKKVCGFKCSGQNNRTTGTNEYGELELKDFELAIRKKVCKNVQIQGSGEVCAIDFTFFLRPDVF
jgi:hypothetical protein